MGDDRHETATERLDRNWNEMLQELRVLQTGVQLLTGFLLTLPFQQRFLRISHTERGIYLATVACSIAATVFLQTPVIVHRMLFRRHQRAETVLLAHRLALLGAVLLGLAVVGVTTLIASVVSGPAAGVAVGATALALLLVMWVVVPLAARGEGKD